jgi:hypothetical protein
MSLLKLPKYVEMPGHVSPVTGCKPGDIAPLVVLGAARVLVAAWVVSMTSVPPAVPMLPGILSSMD